jgi:hypothetical protein
VPNGGRAVIHFWVDAEGDLYFMSMSDGMIRQVTGVAAAK